jgi:hypothetical protein
MRKEGQLEVTGGSCDLLRPINRSMYAHLELSEQN